MAELHPQHCLRFLQTKSPVAQADLSFYSLIFFWGGVFKFPILVLNFSLLLSRAGDWTQGLHMVGKCSATKLNLQLLRINFNIAPFCSLYIIFSILFSFSS